MDNEPIDLDQLEAKDVNDLDVKEIKSCNHKWGFWVMVPFLIFF